MQLFKNSIKPGGLLIEAMLAVAVFGAFVGASYLLLLTGQEGTRYGSQRIRGVNYTIQALEAAKSIRNQDFDNLTEGPHGFTIDPITNSWAFTGSSLVRNGFTTTLTVTALDANIKQLDSVTTWKDGIFRSGRAAMTTIVTNWRADTGVGDWSNITQAGSWTAGKQVNFTSLYSYKNYVYISNEGATYGTGLYIIDVTNPASPTRVSTAFNIAANVYNVIAYHDLLYITTASDPDIRVYNIASPTGLDGSTTAVASESTISGGNHAKSLAIKNDVLYVGGDGSSGAAEILSYSIATGSTLTQLDTLDLTGNIAIDDLYIDGTVAYAGGNNGFMYMIDISDPTNLLLLTSRQMGLQAVTGIRASGTGFYTTLSNGLDEYSMRTSTGTSTPFIPSSDGGNLQGVDLSANGNDLDSDPYGCYNFLATGNSSKELQIRNPDLTMAELTNANLTTGEARVVHYDTVNDQLYVATQSGMYIYDPGTTSTCP